MWLYLGGAGRAGTGDDKMGLFIFFSPPDARCKNNADNPNTQTRSPALPGISHIRDGYLCHQMGLADIPVHCRKTKHFLITFLWDCDNTKCRDYSRTAGLWQIISPEPANTQFIDWIYLDHQSVQVLHRTWLCLQLQTIRTRNCVLETRGWCLGSNYDQILCPGYRLSTGSVSRECHGRLTKSFQIKTTFSAV